MNEEEKNFERDEDDKLNGYGAATESGSAEEAESSDSEEFEHPDYEQELIGIIRSDLPLEEKKEALGKYHYNDIADVLESLTSEERESLIELIGAEEASEVYAYLDDASDYLEELDVEVAADILENMDADDAVDVLEDLDEDAQQAIIEQMDQEAQEDIRLIQSYDEDEIGSKMTTNYIVIHRGNTVKQAMRSVVEQAEENDNVSTLYILNDDDTFYGTITLQDLIIAREHTELDTLIDTSYPCVVDHQTVEACIEDLKDYSLDSIPVVDSRHRMLGVITSQDLVEVVDEEMGDDLAKLAGLTGEADLNEGLFKSLGKRIPWLLVLMILGLFVSAVVGIFEPVVAQLTVVVAFQSLILGMSGNVGTQSLAVTIRVLMDENVSGREKLHLIFKELRVGMNNGLIMGSISCVLVGLYIHLVKHEALRFSFQVSSCLGIAMLLAMSISSVTATVIPMFFKKIRIDPAVASGPLITTLNDLVAVVTYYGLVLLLLIPALA